MPVTRKTYWIYSQTEQAFEIVVACFVESTCKWRVLTNVY